MLKKNEKNRKSGKKEIDEKVIARFHIEDQEENSPFPRRRLRKLNEINQSEEMIDASAEEDNLFAEVQQPRYEQFGLKDDEELRKQQEAQENAKKNKKLKGNQQLDKFIEKQTKKDKPSKEEKPKPVLQMTIEEMMRIKKQKQQKRKKSDDFLDISEKSDGSIDENEFQAKRLAAYEKYNGSMEDQQKQIEKAIKLSLTASSIDKKQVLEDYAYEPKITKNPSQLFLQNQKQKRPVTKQKQVKSQKKQPKKPKPLKQQKAGPFAGLVIVFTGEYQNIDKDKLIQVCNQLGAECPKSVTKTCNLLMQGQYVLDHFKRKSNQPINQTNKSKLAIERGIQILSADKLEDFFYQKTGFTLDHHLNKNKVVNISINNFISKPIHIQQDGQKIKLIQNVFQKIAIKTEQKMDVENKKETLHLDRRLWTQKYKPNSLDDVIGENSQIKALRQWLQNWDDIHIKGNKREVKQTKGWNAAGSINSFAALLSGDPGIGKTTTARLLAMEYNYAVTEYNASDVRNKSGVNLIQSSSFNINIAKTLSKSLIIMDEVDGMSSGDRGGVTAIINMIKSTKVPIICICNDRSSEKIRSLAGHCLDVKFHKPHKGMIVKRLKQILVKEGGSGQDRALEQLVQTFQNDMRQILSYLEVIFRTVSKKITIDALSSKNRSSKDTAVMINHFDASRKLLNRTQFSRMKISQRNDCFFVDSEMVPLMIHENLLNSARKNQLNEQQFHNLVKGIKGVVIGDMLDRTIRKQQQWGLMPSFGFMTCVYSTEKISESIGFPQFPAWLGKFSSQRKMKRLAKEFKDTILPSTLNAGWKSSKNLYIPIVIQVLADMLRQELIQDAVMFMEQYRLTPLMINQHLSSLYYNDKNHPSNPLVDIPSNLKGKLTRLFNKRHEDSKLKQTTKAKNKVEHVKFDALMQQVEQQIEEQQELEEEKVAKGKIKGKQPKNKKK